MVPSGQTYKVKLANGRVLGPLDLERIRRLILKNQITGAELIRDAEGGEWQKIGSIASIADMLLAHAQGHLAKKKSEVKPSDAPSAVSPTAATVPLTLPGATQILKGTSSFQSLPELQSISASKTPQDTAPLPSGAGNVPDVAASEIAGVEVDPEHVPVKDELASSSPPTLPNMKKIKPEETDEPCEKTLLGGIDQEADPTYVMSLDERMAEGSKSLPELDFPALGLPSVKREPRKISEEPTVVFQGVRNLPEFLRTKPKKGKMGGKEFFKMILAGIALGFVGYELFLAEPDKQSEAVRMAPIRPRLPSFMQGKTEPQKSAELYQVGLKLYLQDTVAGYKAAAERLQLSASHDIGNVKALAMLASTYLNLIDSSNKDENYFSTISKLIEMSRAKAIDLPETVIADVEYFITANKAEAAQNRIVEYTKTHQKFGNEMLYYLALAFYHRGDAQTAARYLAQFPDNKAFSAKIFYLRGLVAEKLDDIDSAFKQYLKALQLNNNHAKSRLRIAALLNKRGSLKEAGKHLDTLLESPALLAPKDLATAYYLHSLYSQREQKWDQAIFDMERAVRLDKGNHDYLLELYTLRAKEGDSSPSMRKEARMYYFLSEGEKLLREGKHAEALSQFLLARKENNSAPLPLIKIGDMFRHLNDLANARINYKLAADKASNNIEVWSKYISVLIQSYEWEEAQKAMERFRKLPVHQSAIDKAAADMYEKQGRNVEAQVYYRKAMARDVIDPDVYIAYAKSLMNSKNFKDAPFFFALALRFDPLNLDALVGTAKCIAATESIDRGINMLQDELQKGGGARAELLAAIAELQIQKGAWEQARQNIEQAMEANPDYAYPWKLQAQVHMNQDGVEKGALDKALYAYKQYSDRNASDPSGYLERYKIYIRKTEFDKANEELNKIYGVFPKYPNLHYYKGALYAVMGNHNTALDEYKIELKNNPNSVVTMVALGKEYIEMGNANEALNFFVKAMQLAPQAPEPKHQAAYANYLLKNYAAAIALYQAALVYDKANPVIYKRMGLAYREMGDTPNAATAFRKYLEMEPDAPDRAEFERFR